MRVEGKKVRKDRLFRCYDSSLHFELASLIVRDLRDQRTSSSELTHPADRPKFPPLPSECVEDLSWYLLWAAPWQFEEPIHRLEGRASAALVRWLARLPGAYCKRVLIQCDNLSCTHAFDKVRAGDRGLLALCRRVGAIQVASKMRIRWRYIESHRNTSDQGSRMFERKGAEVLRS